MFIFTIIFTVIVYLFIFNKSISLIYGKTYIKKYLQLNILSVVVFFLAASTDVFATPSRFLMQLFSDNLNNFLGNTPLYIKFPISVMVIYSPLLFVTIGIISLLISFQINLRQLINIFRSINTIDLKYNLINSRYEALIIATACIFYCYLFGSLSLVGILVNGVLFSAIILITISYPADDSLLKVLARFLAMLLMVFSTSFFVSNGNRLDYYMNFVIPIFYVSCAYGFYLNSKAE
ncbi:hypothetical protein WH367_23105 [Comamonas sp. MYb21]